MTRRARQQEIGGEVPVGVGMLFPKDPQARNQVADVGIGRGEALGIQRVCRI